MRLTRTLLLLAAVLLIGPVLLTACSGNQEHRAREDTLLQWEASLRWSDQYDALVDFMHPDWLADNPVTQLDIDRLGQFRITEYRVRQVLAEPDGMGLERRVQLRLYHVHTARERVIDHREIWRYDEASGRWLLHSGLPDPRRN